MIRDPQEEARPLDDKRNAELLAMPADELPIGEPYAEFCEEEGAWWVYYRSDRRVLGDIDAAGECMCRDSAERLLSELRFFRSAVLSAQHDPA